MRVRLNVQLVPPAAVGLSGGRGLAQGKEERRLGGLAARTSFRPHFPTQLVSDLSFLASSSVQPTRRQTQDGLAAIDMTSGGMPALVRNSSKWPEM